MPAPPSILFADAIEQSNALAAGKLSSKALLNATLAAIDTLNPKLNCYLLVDRQRALLEADASDQRRALGGTLSVADGLIVAVKDNINIAGLPTTAGTGAVLHENKPDALVIERLRRAGVIILGKLNMDEAAVGTSNANPHHGQCLNPKYPAYVPGGSSGGSASAVAAGLCSMALGTDTMGSVRIPAACCGVVGLKPSFNAIPTKGTVPCARKLDTVGPICRSLRDLKIWLPILFGTAPSESNRNIDDLKLGLFDDLNNARPLEPVIYATYQKAIDILRERGLSLSKKYIGEHDFAQIRRAGLISVEAELSELFKNATEDDSTVLSEQLSSLIQWYRKQDGSVKLSADEKLKKTADFFHALMADIDCLILPTLPQRVTQLDSATPEGFADLTAPANIAGLPAITFPFITQEGQEPPISLQLIGKPESDYDLVLVAQKIQETLLRSITKID